MRHWLDRALSALDLPAIIRGSDEKREAGIPQREEDLALYHFPMCPYCIRTRLTARALGIALPMRNIHARPAAARELIEGGGRMTVPCLRIRRGDRDEWLYESSDIIRYLQRRHART